VRQNRSFIQSIARDFTQSFASGVMTGASTSDIVRATAALTLTGALATPLAAHTTTESPRPAPAVQPSATPQPSTTPQNETPASSGSGSAPAPAAPSTTPSAEPAPAPTATEVPPAAPTASGQSQQPAPQPGSGGDDPRTVASFQPTPPANVPPSQLRGVREGRRTLDDKPVRLSFKGVGVEEILPFLYEWTGKYVSYKPTEVSSNKITLIGDRDISKSLALDYIFQSLKANGLAVTETEDLIHIGLQTDLIKTQPGVVLGPEEDVMKMEDNGLFVTKVFRLKHSRATDVLERIEFLVPEDYAKLSADGDSNQIILAGDIGLAKKVKTLLDMLDVPSWDDYATETFRLQYQDANAIKTIIDELFTDDGSAGGRTAGGRTQQNRNQQQQQRQPGVPGAAGGGEGGGLIVTVLESMNSITVRATPTVLAEIRRLVANAWDLPPNTAGSIFRIYDLNYADPSKVRDLLGTLLGGGSSSSRNNTQNRAFAGRQVLQGGGGVGDGSPSAAVEGIFSIEAYPDSNRLIVISKTPENFDWLDRWIKDLDQPFTSGLPVNVPLKHASAVELSEILNTLLAQSGSEGGGLRLPEEGIQGLADSFNTGVGAANDSSVFNQGQNQQQNQLTFPWQGARAGQGAGGTPQEVSALIGRSRIVPNPTQNSVLVMAPAEVEKKVIEIIHQLDKPGRQVMITAVLAEVKVGDGFSWGARVGTNLSAPLNGGDNAVAGSVSLNLEKGNGSTPPGPNFASPWFDSSELTVSTGENMEFFLQALSTDNSVRILQQPRVFTSDNKEAKFVAGQDVSLLTGETSGFGTTGTTSSFEQQFVGVGINVRPRITQDNNVAMEVEVLLSNLSASTASFNSNPVIDRRQTNTNVTVKDGQTIVISGIRREQETQIDNKIPFLGDIPVLGAAFTSTQRQKEVVELVVFLVPTVVENPDANDANFNADERMRLRLLAEPLEKSANDLLKESKFFEELKSPPPVEPALEPINETIGTDKEQKGTP
jgi:general secretion pathway protein D